MYSFQPAPLIQVLPYFQGTYTALAVYVDPYSCQQLSDDEFNGIESDFLGREVIIVIYDPIYKFLCVTASEGLVFYRCFSRFDADTWLLFFFNSGAILPYSLPKIHEKDLAEYICANEIVTINNIIEFRSCSNFTLVNSYVTSAYSVGVAYDFDSRRQVSLLDGASCYIIFDPLVKYIAITFKNDTFFYKCFTHEHAREILKNVITLEGLPSDLDLEEIYDLEVNAYLCAHVY